MSAFCLVEGRRGGSRRIGAGKGPRPRPATTPVKAHAQLRFYAQRARLVDSGSGFWRVKAPPDFTAQPPRGAGGA
eukprot:scaffold4053_cov21-Phaeocystis_antarctica.AAC.1